jgi:hypothetical protein
MCKKRAASQLSVCSKNALGLTRMPALNNGGICASDCHVQKQRPLGAAVCCCMILLAKIISQCRLQQCCNNIVAVLNSQQVAVIFVPESGKEMISTHAAWYDYSGCTTGW